MNPDISRISSQYFSNSGILGSSMKIKICDSPVYLHRIGKGIHIDLEHPLFVRIIEREEKAFCQGKGEHGLFIALNREMMTRARNVMAETLEDRFKMAWGDIVELAREIGWEKVQEMMERALQDREEEASPANLDDAP